MPNDTVIVHLGQLRANRYQPATRLDVSNETADKFADSILQFGLLQTPTVRAVEGGHYEIADGWLRYNGYKRLAARGLKDYDSMPVQVRELTDRQMADIILEANTIRQDLNPIELGCLFKSYIEDFKIGQDELAKRHHCSQGEISNTIRLLSLPEVIRQRIISNGLKETHARALLPLKNPLQMALLADEIQSKGMTVQAVEAKVRSLLGREKKEKQVPGVPAKHKENTPAVKQTSGHPERSCRVCGCTEEHACQGGCTWVEPNLCSKCSVTLDEAIKTEESKPFSVSKETKPAAAAKQPTETAPPATPSLVSSPAKSTWKRKLVLEEKDGYVTASVMREGAFPVMKHIEGTLESILDTPCITGFLAETTEQWLKEKK